MNTTELKPLSQEPLVFSDDEVDEELVAELKLSTDKFLRSITSTVYNVEGVKIEPGLDEKDTDIKSYLDRDPIFQSLLHISKQPVQDVFLRTMMAPPKDMDHYDIENHFMPTPTKKKKQIDEIKTEEVQVKQECSEELRTPDRTDSPVEIKEENDSGMKKKIDTPIKIIMKRNQLLAEARQREMCQSQPRRRNRSHSLVDGVEDGLIEADVLDEKDGVYVPPTSVIRKEKVGGNTWNGVVILEEEEDIPSSPRKLRKRKIDNWESEDDQSLYDVQVNLQIEKAKTMSLSEKRPEDVKRRSRIRNAVTEHRQVKRRKLFEESSDSDEVDDKPELDRTPSRKKKDHRCRSLFQKKEKEMEEKRRERSTSRGRNVISSGTPRKTTKVIHDETPSKNPRESKLTRLRLVSPTEDIREEESKISGEPTPSKTRVTLNNSDFESD